ncbi:MAG: TRAP transporter small permease subunit [Thiothrix sp.]|nr:TRAP transporter small permease subunit [Thiothrix sp.]HPQ97053.1 TRAP transporter small permease subunit [Thiolinea sp.]
MYDFCKSYVRIISRINKGIGILAMYLVLAMMGILLYSSFSRGIGSSPLWVIEMAQFVMAAYYTLGGGYSLQMDAHVRMDVFYSRWSPRTQAVTDAFTVLCLIVYLVLLIYGGVSSSIYALETGQKNYSAWGPYMAPVKLIMTFGMLLMLLQVLASLFQHVAEAVGRPFELSELMQEREGMV